MYVLSQRVPLRSRRRNVYCTHVGAGREAIRIAIMRHDKLTGSSRHRVLMLPTFRLCCKRSIDARIGWWRTVNALFDRVAEGSSRFARERRDLERDIRALVPRPRGSTLTKRVAALARRVAREAEEAACAELMRPTSACWTILSLPPGVGPRRVKEGLAETLARLNRRGAGLAELREAEAAALECQERLRTGIR